MESVLAFALLIVLALVLTPGISRAFTSSPRCPNGSIPVTISVRVEANSPAAESDSFDQCDCTADSGKPEYCCPLLQSALANVVIPASQQEDECSVFVLYLDAGIHYIEKPLSLNASVSFVGSEEGSVLVCSFTGTELDASDEVLHSLYFNHSCSVSFENIEAQHCPLPFRLDTVTQVGVVNSTFRYFTEAVFDIFNCEQIVIELCNFSHNSGTGIVKVPFRGNTGAVSIGYDNMRHACGNPSINVTNSTFWNNSAFAGINFLTADEVFFSGVLTGRGGGMAAFINEPHYNVSVVMKDCMFKENYARSFAGGLYYLFSGTNAQHRGLVENTLFVNNVAEFGGGGFVGVGTKGIPGVPHTHTLTNCHFEGNRGDGGGAIYYSINLQGQQNNQLRMEGLVFVANGAVNEEQGFGAAVGVDVTEDFGEKESLPVHSMRNCVYINNAGSNGIVSIGYLPFNLSGRNQFIGNTGSALRVIGARMIVGGELEFINNTAINGAALSLLSFAQLQLQENVTILFLGNKGRYGASLFVDAAHHLSTFSILLYNPLCFLLNYPSPLLSPLEWGKLGINMTFSGNSAWFGSVVYATSLDPCQWVGPEVFNFNLSMFPSWPIFNIRNDTGDAYSSDQDYAFSTDPADASLDPGQLSGWPGEKKSITIHISDDLGNPTGYFTHLAFSSNSTQNLGRSRLDPNTFLLSTTPFVASFTYHLDKDSTELLENATTVLVDVDSHGFVTKTSAEINDNLQLTLTGCPGGYELEDELGDGERLVCTCDKQQQQVLSCENDQDSVVIADGKWAGLVDDKSHNLFFYSCPSGYCQCFLNTSVGPGTCVNVYTNSDPNRQCACSRTGILCGECANGTGVSALLNKCVTCSDASILIIIGLIIVDAIIMIVIVVGVMRYPSFIYPCSFYIQVLPFVTEAFPQYFSSIQPYLYFISSAMSFYFVYDFCLAKSLSTVVSYSLRLIPFVLLSITVVTVSVLHKLKWKFIPVYQKVWNGAWLVLLLIYTHTVHTCMSVLNCPSIPANGSVTSQWFVDGEIQCFTGRHLPLALAAIFVLLVCVAAIPFVIILAVKEFEGSPLLIKRLQKSVVVGFQFQYWYSFELLRRLLVLLMVIVLPGSQYPALFFFCFNMVLYSYVKPYKSNITNRAEVVLSINAVVLLLTSIPTPFFEITSGTMDTSQTTECFENTAHLPFISYLLALSYYFPVLVAMILLALPVAHILRKQYMRLKVKRRTLIINDGELDSDDIPFKGLRSPTVSYMDFYEIDPD